MRAFVAVLPPQPAVEDLSDFLTPRREASGAGAPAPRWTRDEHLHLTLAFLPEVADRDVDELVERLGEAAAARTVGPVRLAGAYARAWGSEFVRVPKAGHINVESGHGDWPLGLALLESLTLTPSRLLSAPIHNNHPSPSLATP